MKKMPKRISAGTLTVLAATVLTLTCAVGYTVAWLSDTHKLDAVVFQDSDIKIVFEDDKTAEAESVKMVPGHNVDKAPTVTVKADSEKCYLFMKVDKGIGKVGQALLDGEGNEIASFDDFIVYSVDSVKEDVPGDDGWLQLTDSDGKAIDDVYYRIVESSESDQSFGVLEGGEYRMDDLVYTWGEDQILINPEITLEMQSQLTEETNPELSFTCYAIQYYKSNELPFTAYEAWAKVSA